jgi:hypothetical protein
MRFTRLLLIVPCLTLLVAFGVICVHFHTAWPWETIVHENGQRTLLETVLYFEHALGELPLEVLLAAAVAGAVLSSAKPAVRKSSGSLTGLILVAIGIDAFLFAGAWRAVGYKTAMHYLLQYHTRDQAPLEFGSHWRYHLLSQASLMLLPVTLAGLKGRAWLLHASWGAFAVLSLIFGVNGAPFFDPRYLGHEARETFTHALVTIPLAVELCLAMSQTAAGAGGRGWWLATGACALLVIYQVAGAIVTGSRAHAQTSDFVRVVCSHFFEHTFSYLVVPIHSALFYVTGFYLAGART